MEIQKGLAQRPTPAGVRPHWHYAQRLMTCFRGERRWRLAPLALTAAGIAALIAGCAGSSGGAGNGAVNNNKTLSGKNLGVAIGIANAKSTVAGVAIPFAVLKATSPVLKAAFVRPSLVTAVAGLNLYSNQQVSGNTLTLSFYTDAQGKNSAGTISVVGTETIGSAYTYPVSFHATGSITGGTIPLTADFTVVFTDARGANTLNGNLNLTSDGVGLALNMSLDDNGNVGSSGTVIATYTYYFQGQQVPVVTTLSSLTGSPTTTINGNAAVDATVPVLGDQMGTGVGTLDLVHGSFTLTLTGGSLKGLIEAFNGGNDTLTVTPAGGGSPSVIPNATTFNIASLLAASGGGGGSTGYQAPVAVQGSGGVTVEQTLGDGEMVGFALDSSNRSTGYYWPSPTAAPQTLPAPTGGSHTAAHGIATYSGQTVIVGSYQDSNGIVQPCFWTITSGAFQPYTANGTLAYGGVFQGISANGNTIVGYSIASNAMQQPMAYISGTLYPLPSDGRYANLRAIAVDNNNNILGGGDGSAPVPGVWSQVSVNASGSITTPFKALPELSGVSGAPQATHMSDNGVIVGGDGQNGLYWQPSDGFVAHALPIGSNAGAMGYGVNHAGTQAAGNLYATSPSTVEGIAFWSSLTGAPVDVSAKLGSLQGNYQNPTGLFILDDGSIIATAFSPPSTNLQFIYIQNK